MVKRFHIFVWAGSALLGWIAGEMFAKDPALHSLGMPHGAVAHYISAAIGALAVLAVGYWLKRRSEPAKSSL
jgi:predicted tellurium resistance membrane protein TerC